MTYLRMRPRAAGVATMLAMAVLAVGCSGDAGPPKYQVSGMVTFGGKPIGKGDIIFEPQEGLRNVQSMTRSSIRDGRYNAEIVGGLHNINVRDMTGNPDMDPEGAKAGRRPLLNREYRGQVEFPLLDAVKDSPVTKDIEIGKSAKK